MSSGEGDNENEGAAGETLEEAGALEADVGAHFFSLQSRHFVTKCGVSHTFSDPLRGVYDGYSDQQLSSIDPKLKIDMDPYAHRDLRPEMMFIREELRQAKWQTLAVRRIALKNLLLSDFLQEDCELRNIGLAYAPPDP